MLFSGSMLDGLSTRQRAKLVNQYSLGLGSPTAPVIFIGSEHAYSLEDTLPFSLEAVGLTILWLCGGKTDITTRISGMEWGSDVPFHIHPNALYRSTRPNEASTLGRCWRISLRWRLASLTGGSCCQASDPVWAT